VTRHASGQVIRLLVIHLLKETGSPCAQRRDTGDVLAGRGGVRSVPALVAVAAGVVEGAAEGEENGEVVAHFTVGIVATSAEGDGVVAAEGADDVAHNREDDPRLHQRPEDATREV